MKKTEIRGQKTEVSGLHQGEYLRAAPCACPLPRSGNKRMCAANSSGMALIVTLGILTIITLAIVAFVVTMRIETLAARNTLHRTMARQYVDIGLSTAMGLVNEFMTTNVSCYPVQGWSTNTPDLPHFFEQDCFGSPCTNGDPIGLFHGAATNLLPGVLAAQAGQVCSGWVNIMETNETTGVDGIPAGRVAFLVVNLSGLMDVHALNTNRWSALNEPGQSVYNLLNPTGAYQRVFLTQPDLTAANNQTAVSNLVTFSYDPGPDVFFTNLNLVPFGTREFGGMLTNRFNINLLATNVANISIVSNLLASAGVPFPDKVAWNIYNYVIPGQIPVPAGATPPFRTDYCVKDVPLISEVALEQIPGPLTNHYGVSVELWYPFVPHASPVNSRLWVGVYTNATSVANEYATFNGGYGAPPSPLGFEAAPPIPMNYGESNEFFVGSTTNAGAAPIVFEEVIVDSEGPPRITHTNYLPVSAANPVWIWPRVYVGNTCVDEALVDTAVAAPNVWTWTDTGSIQFADPRANNSFANITNGMAVAQTLGTTNANCSVRSLPLVLADAPMLSAGEIRHIYAPGMPGGVLDLSTEQGAACLDRFTVRETNSPVHGLVQANTPYTNIWRALMSDIPIGWTNSLHTDTQQKLSDILPDCANQMLLAGAIANAVAIPNPPPLVRGWTCYQEMLPLAASNLNLTLGSTATTNANAFAELQDILAGLADRVSFRQNTFLIIVCGQRLSPLGPPPRGRVLADQRAAYTVVRDAYTGRWVVDHVVWLTE